MPAACSGVARQNYYLAKRAPTTATQLRRQWLTGLIREVHVASRGTYGYRRVHAELTLGMGITVCERTVSVLMTQAGIYGLPGPTRVKRLRGVVTADDLVNRKFHRLHPNELWVTDITQHRTREGWLYCAAVLDAFSRRIVGWSIDSKQDSTLVVNALDMAIRNRRPEPGGIVHADHGAQFTSWVFGDKIRSAGLLPSFGTVGDGLDNAMMESFWSSMQIELLNRRKMEDPGRAGQRDLRVHRDLPQPPTPPLRPRLPHPDRIRTTVRTTPHRRSQLANHTGTKRWVRSNCHLFVQQTRRSRLAMTSCPPFSVALLPQALVATSRATPKDVRAAHVLLLAVLATEAWHSGPSRRIRADASATSPSLRLFPAPGYSSDRERACVLKAEKSGLRTAVAAGRPFAYSGHRCGSGRTVRPVASAHKRTSS